MENNIIENKKEENEQKEVEKAGKTFGLLLNWHQILLAVLSVVSISFLDERAITFISGFFIFLAMVYLWTEINLIGRKDRELRSVKVKAFLKNLFNILFAFLIFIIVVLLFFAYSSKF